LENGDQRPAPETRPAWVEIPEIAGQRPGRASLTRGNVADSHTPGNNTPETGGRIRTSAWRNQYPRDAEPIEGENKRAVCVRKLVGESTGSRAAPRNVSGAVFPSRWFAVGELNRVVVGR
jgi:hypothetical protein